MSDDKKRIIDLLDKDSRIYKFMDRFLDDDQKGDLLVTLLVNGVWVAYHIPIVRGMIREELMENGSFFKCITKNHICFVAFDSQNALIDILYKKKKFLGRWRELELSEDLSKTLHLHMRRRKLKKNLNTIMNLMAFS